MDAFKTRILIADPDPDIQQTLRLYFESNGHEVQTVSQANNIIMVARPWQPNAILISDEFIDRNPYQVCRDILDDTLAGHIPVIMLLHINERHAKLEALEVGVNDVVTKPFDIEELCLRVEAAIRLSTMRVVA